VELIEAAGHGDAAKVQELLAGGANVRAVDSNRWTALGHAAFSGHDQVVRLLLEAGADINARDAENGTPLALAASLGHEAAVRTLLEHGADVHVSDKDGKTPLHEVASEDNPALLEALLDKGANVNARATDGSTPLSVAVVQSLTPNVLVLLARDADPNTRDENGHTPLMHAAFKREDHIAQALLDAGADPNAQRPDGATPLMMAVAQDAPATVDVLLAARADVGPADKGGSTAMQLSKEHPEMDAMFSAAASGTYRSPTLTWQGQEYTFSRLKLMPTASLLRIAASGKDDLTMDHRRAVDGDAWVRLVAAKALLARRDGDEFLKEQARGTGELKRLAGAILFVKDSVYAPRIPSASGEGVPLPKYRDLWSSLVTGSEADRRLVAALTLLGATNVQAIGRAKLHEISSMTIKELQERHFVN
jgi:ankyrin repeat protein